MGQSEKIPLLKAIFGFGQRYFYSVTTVCQNLKKFLALL